MDLPDPSLVVLVDENDAEMGTMDKNAAHAGDGRLHRAVSVCLIDQSRNVLLQRRARDKYHFANYWSNSCCTHPLLGESPHDAAIRRLSDELGVVLHQLDYCGRFIYRAKDPTTDLVEWELDHVFTGSISGPLSPNPREVSALCWKSIDSITLTGATDELTTPWMHSVIDLAR
jgi:isopentenyl-diphosphate Delta-isomerase